MFQYKRIVTELLEENTYILYNEDKECIIIDPGYGFKLIDSFILSNNLKPLAILATHAHIDHIASASNFIDKYNIDSYVCENEKLIAENFHRAVDYWGMSDVIKKPNVSHWIKIDQKNLQISNFNFSMYFSDNIDFLFEKEIIELTPIVLLILSNLEFDKSIFTKIYPSNNGDFIVLILLNIFLIL